MRMGSRSGLAFHENAKRVLVFVMVFMVLPLAAFGFDKDQASYLEQKAIAYDEWFQQWNSPHYGPAVNVRFADDTYSEVVYWGGRGDSTIWTGSYLGAEAMRYAVTRDPIAKANAIRAVHTLHGHLKVTGTRGFIARFRAPYEAPYWHGCDMVNGDCHPGVGEEYENDFWFGNTSRDQYTGWWFGMSLAHDLIDDEEVKALIREDLEEVLTTLAFYDYTITDETGNPSKVAADIIVPMQFAWHLITAVASEEDYFMDWYAEHFEEAKGRLPFDSWVLFNKYQEYYGNNLTNQAFFNLFRLENNYRRLQIYVDVYRDKVRPHVGWTHNAFFDLIYLTGCRRIGGCEDIEPIVADVIETLDRMTDAPNKRVGIVLSEQEVDPFSIFLSDLADRFDPTGEVLKFKPQSLEPRVWEDRCREDFVWQRTPFDLEGTCGGDELYVYPGADYLAAYWMGRYLDLIPPGNPYWEDDTIPGPNGDEGWSDDDTPPGDDDDVPPFDQDDDDEGQGTQESGDDDNSSCGGS